MKNNKGEGRGTNFLPLKREGLLERGERGGLIKDLRYQIVGDSSDRLLGDNNVIAKTSCFFRPFYFSYLSAATV